jgi:hypothetical protein
LVSPPDQSLKDPEDLPPEIEGCGNESPRFKEKPKGVALSELQIEDVVGSYDDLRLAADGEPLGDSLDCAEEYS